MYYFALLQTPQRDLTPAQGQAEMQAYGDFHAREHSAIRAGDALAPDGVRISGGADNPLVTDGPFAEGAEVAGGYYVFEADDLDEALRLARQIPAAQYGAVEVWPMLYWNAPQEPTTGQDSPQDRLRMAAIPERRIEHDVSRLWLEHRNDFVNADRSMHAGRRLPA